jgi:hypothetical protein
MLEQNAMAFMDGQVSWLQQCGYPIIPQHTAHSFSVLRLRLQFPLSMQLSHDHTDDEDE